MSTSTFGDGALLHLHRKLPDVFEDLPNLPLLGFVSGAVLSSGLWVVLGWIAYRLLA